jgi:hypothetical protein
MAKIKLGDIFEIVTPIGKAYLHYIYKDQSIGDMIRVLPGIYSERPANFEQLAGSKERYMVFFPVLAANKRRIIEQVGHYSATGFTKPAYMRTEHTVRGEFLGWHIINTETWQRQLAKKLSPEQKELSPWGVWNDTLLIEMIVNNWSLQNWN